MSLQEKGSTDCTPSPIIMESQSPAYRKMNNIGLFQTIKMYFIFLKQYIAFDCLVSYTF